MTKAPELKPCPWCGGTNITKVDDGESEWLICATCEATGPYSPDAYAANLTIEQAWNTRAATSPEAFQQMREALKICIEQGSVYGHKAAVAALKAAEGE